MLIPREEHSRGHAEFRNENLKQIGQGFSELRSVKQTDRQTNRDFNFINILAWEHSAAQVT